ncbi:hypothetical protein ACLK1S_24785 [Escherichia coli]
MEELVTCRNKGESSLFSREQVEYMDVSTNRLFLLVRHSSHSLNTMTPTVH